MVLTGKYVDSWHVLPDQVVAALAEQDEAPASDGEQEEEDDEDEDDDEWLQEDAPDGMECPISLKLMTDPVTAADGFNYQREALLAWTRHTEDPKRESSPPLWLISLECIGSLGCRRIAWGA